MVHAVMCGEITYGRRDGVRWNMFYRYTLEVKGLETMGIRSIANVTIVWEPIA